MRFSRLFWIGALLFFATSVNGQSLPVGTPVLEDYYRRLQLTGEVDSNVSFAVRPLVLGALANESFGSFADTAGSRLFTNPITNSKKSLVFAVLPATWRSQYNAHHPYGWNDGAMVPAKGFQTLVSAGVFVKAGPLTIQLQPELVYALNTRFTALHSDISSRDVYHYNRDIPERFGEHHYSKLLPGQSSIRLNVGPVSLGYSSENLWWGPGMRSSLLMSNNAPGFNHVSLNTKRPIKTPVGAIEFQVVGGRLEGSDYAVGLPNDWRYMSGVVLSYQPKWVPGLFAGMTRSFQMYNSDMDGSFGDYFPLFQAFEKVKTNEGQKLRDQVMSVYLRWLWKEAHAEIYAEHGWNDHALNFRDLILSPEHSRTYLIGFSKVVPDITSKRDYLQVKLELTQLAQGIDRKVRDAGTWYVHTQVVHGYTHKGQVLGAGIGPSGNLQSAEIAFGRGLNRLGLQLERYVHNSDFYDVAFPGQDDPWVDLSAAAIGDYQFKNFLLSGSVNFIRSANYQWRNSIGEPGGKALNVSARLAIMYRFN